MSTEAVVLVFAAMFFGFACGWVLKGLVDGDVRSDWEDREP